MGEGGSILYLHELSIRSKIQILPRLLFNSNGALMHLQMGLSIMMTSITACLIHTHPFFAPFAISPVQMEFNFKFLLLRLYAIRVIVRGFEKISLEGANGFNESWNAK